MPTKLWEKTRNFTFCTVFSKTVVRGKAFSGLIDRSSIPMRYKFARRSSQGVLDFYL